MSDLNIKAEECADSAEELIDNYSDQQYQTDEGVAGLETDIADVITNLHHLCDRYGVSYPDVIDRAELGYQGDCAEGGEADSAQQRKLPDEFDTHDPFGL